VVVEDRRASSIKNPEEARQQAAAVAAALAGPADGAALERAASLVRAGSLRRASPVAAAAAAAEKAEGAAPSAEVELVVLEEEEVGYPLAWWVADALSLAALALLTVGSIYWAATKTTAASSPFANSGAAIAILLGPPGALLRFRLSQYNGSLKALKWFPLGTFAANMIACVVDYAIRAGLERAPQQLPFTHEALLTGIMLGFCGSLSTVSTWVVEVGGLRVMGGQGEGRAAKEPSGA
jgi:fluoride ion exporter CrcB/FEX